MTAPNFSQNPDVIPFLYVINRLLLNASSVSTPEALGFLMVNDTIHLLRYDRAVLYDFETKKVVAISGQANLNDAAPLVKALEQAIGGIKNPEEMAGLSDNVFADERAKSAWQNLKNDTKCAVFWLPILHHKKIRLGLWLEQWDTEQFKLTSAEVPVLLRDFLLPSYGMAWERVTNKFSIKKMLGISKQKAAYITLALLAALLLIRIPLRVAAPCEIVPKNPFVIRAPLEGIVKEIAVQPGQWVHKNDLLFQYDKEVLEHALKTAQEEVEIKQSELDRAAVQGLKDKKQLDELTLLFMRLKKENINLDFLKYQTGKLSVTSPEDGIVIIDAPDEWRGKPVRVGEKVLVVSSTEDTQIKIWIPESDNVPLDPGIPIKVYLNVAPTRSYAAHIEYISNEVSLSDREVPSFTAKADWESEPPPDVKLGLKGTAILYGESVSLLYYIARRPWLTLRNFLGM